MTRASTIGRTDAARKGWETRKANEASRARRFDEVLAENVRIKQATRDLLAAIKTGVVNSSSPVYRAAEEAMRS